MAKLTQLSKILLYLSIIYTGMSMVIGYVTKTPAPQNTAQQVTSGWAGGYKSAITIEELVYVDRKSQIKGAVIGPFLCVRLIFLFLC